ncbi:MULTISPECIES: hypothetical protein [Haloarcula]|uniref:DUF7982 domain-containing protein n=1 Tax=Haloarcula pellucida TaxID=1427151 RepID=A0A830GRK2_9EURY|nr:MULTISPECIES: hypothetical protein [Halomicroarcula]MBX0350215.1 hypothetical protein [Halomicroarcula pellucida]MDS0277683.1 hypothetical protein [Halomicroarcula sp. S1AR25-4]GGO00951.1 hypothetical protein GCM10009030_34140 [Halomicroarcula pellucida]
MDNATHASAGGRLRERFGDRNPAPVFALVGVGLVAAGVGVPTRQTLLFAWGGTALFAALLLQFVTAERTLPARVATDLAATAGTNARRLAGDGPLLYVPDGDSVALTVEESDAHLDPVGVRLLTTLDRPAVDEDPADRLPVLVDYLVEDLELADRATAQTTDGGAEVTVTGTTVGTAELFDHPVASVVGVGLARAVGRPVRVEPTDDDGRLVVTCRWD